MFRSVMVSTAVLCGLFLAADAAAKSPNIPNTPKIVIPRPPAANRILVLPRTITVPTQDESADDGDSNTGKKKKKKVAKKPADAGTEPPLALERQTPPSPNSGNGPQVSEDLKNVLDPDAAELARLRERLEELEGLNDDGSFNPLSTLFPGTEAADPLGLLDRGSQTTGQGNDGDQPSIDDIMSAFFGTGGTGDGRVKDGEQSGGEPPQWGSRGSDVGERTAGPFDPGFNDPSGQVSQRSRGRRGGRIVSTSDGNDWRGTHTTSWREDRRGRQSDFEHEIKNRWHSSTTSSDGTTTTTTYTPSAAGEARGHGSYTREAWDTVGASGTHYRHELYYDADSAYEVVYRENPDGTRTRVRAGPVPHPDSQPTPEGTVTGSSNERGHVGFYNVTCSATGCTYTPLSMEEIMADTGMQINPGGVDRTGPGDISYGPRVGPGAVTDPNPDGVGGNTNSRNPPRPYF